MIVAAVVMRQLELSRQTDEIPERDAVFNEDRTHRFVLRRAISYAPRACLFVMLNPSTADENANDPTIRRCIGFAHEWHFGTLYVANLFSLRSTDPKALYSTPDAEGDPKNIETIVAGARGIDLAVAAWGVHGALRDRGATVRAKLAEAGVKLHHLGLTKDGHPRHPLYLRADVKPKLWEARP
jgi:hypothetical protein